VNTGTGPGHEVAHIETGLIFEHALGADLPVGPPPDS
jgi:hypothetical protein